MPINPGASSGEISRQHRKVLMWPLILALLFGILGIGEPLEDSLRVLRNKVHPTTASGDIVLVRIDDKSLREVGDWPWPRSTQARLYDQLSRLGPKKVAADIMYAGRTTPEDDLALARSIQNAKNVTVAVHSRNGRGAGKEQKEDLTPVLKGRTQVATISNSYNWQFMVWNLPWGQSIDGKWVPSMSSVIADRTDRRGGEYGSTTASTRTRFPRSALPTSCTAASTRPP